ncbi:CRISPR-associated endonuclease Cas1 [Ornithobacterium rhinotracheale]|uniref:CRISPR-associated endonuclease Cas1 n=1 Tax=Ornithobacterium rhinotracheale TaxID=28251 RepID=UPI001FF597AA|nr:CRISPR-associated endonuclease Cas1 [Ornithobacterium rhinotracheale]MCK0205599.1 CRISPR-associated endonuclease Cas1 [Ornithobacterium rhinotracheale]
MILVLNTYGVSLSKDNDCFMISNSEGRQRVPVDQVNSIHISQGAQISSDAILLAVENEIEILFLNKAGAPKGRVWSPKYGSVSIIRKGQVNFSFSQDAVRWIKEIILEKIANQQALIHMFEIKDDTEQQQVNRAINKLEDYRSKIQQLEGNVIPDVAPTLRGWEGAASKVYFQTLNKFIPQDLRFKARSQHPALDPINAMLNYGYGTLYGVIEGELIKAGVDPYVGVLHRDNYNRPVLVYDVIELYRVWVDYVVFSLAAQGVITDDYFSVKEDGSYWLEALGRRILIQSLNDYLEDVVLINGVERSRKNQIGIYASALAQKFKKYN